MRRTEHDFSCAQYLPFGVSSRERCVGAKIFSENVLILVIEDLIGFSQASVFRRLREEPKPTLSKDGTVNRNTDIAMAAILFGGPVTMKRQRFVTNSVFKNLPIQKQCRGPCTKDVHPFLTLPTWPHFTFQVPLFQNPLVKKDFI